MPNAATVCRWLAHEELASFREQYTRAREAQADTIADEVLDIADTPQRGLIVTTKADGTQETKEADMTDHRRLRIDVRKWYAGKLAPKKYGDKLTHAGDAENPLAIDTTTARDRAKALAALVAKQRIK